MSSTGTDGDGNTRHDDDDQRRLTFPLVRADASREIVRSHAFAFRKPGWPDHEPDMKRTLDVVYQDADLMVVHKPPNLLIDADEWSVQEYLQRTYPEVPLFHLIHQIDYATSGIMVLGLEKKSTGRVAKLFQQRLVRKEYVAVVRGWIAQDVTTVSCHIGNDPSVPIRMAVTAEADGK
ncbi:pseudouridine synthase, partial [Blastocladiella britannica]